MAVWPQGCSWQPGCGHRQGPQRVPGSQDAAGRRAECRQGALPAAGPVPDLRPPAPGAGEALSLPATQFVTLALGQPRKHAGSFRPSRLEHKMLFLPGAQFVDA